MIGNVALHCHSPLLLFFISRLSRYYGKQYNFYLKFAGKPGEKLGLNQFSLPAKLFVIAVLI